MQFYHRALWGLQEGVALGMLAATKMPVKSEAGLESRVWLLFTKFFFSQHEAGHFFFVFCLNLSIQRRGNFSQSSSTQNCGFLNGSSELKGLLFHLHVLHPIPLSQPLLWHAGATHYHHTASPVNLCGHIFDACR